MMETNPTVLILLNDLMFQVKIAEAAKRSEVQAVFLKDAALLIRRARQDPPYLVILDLNYQEGHPLETIRTLRTALETAEVQLLGYVSHVQTDQKAAALAAGCHTVVARSAFVENLPALLLRQDKSASAKPNGL